MSEIDTTFGTRLRSLRMGRGWTQGQLAARASMYTTQIHAYEVGRYIPRGAVMARLAQALEMTRDELVTGCALVNERKP